MLRDIQWQEWPKQDKADGHNDMAECKDSEDVTQPCSFMSPTVTIAGEIGAGILQSPTWCVPGDYYTCSLNEEAHIEASMLISCWNHIQATPQRRFLTARRRVDNLKEWWLLQVWENQRARMIYSHPSPARVEHGGFISLNYCFMSGPSCFHGWDQRKLLWWAFSWRDAKERCCLRRIYCSAGEISISVN